MSLYRRIWKTINRVTVSVPKWTRHCTRQNAYLIGRTPVGRVTIAVLRVNDPFRVELRKTLIEEGVVPTA